MQWNAELLSTTRPEPIEKTLLNFKRFIRSQVIASVILLLCASIAIIWANSPFSESYFDLWETNISLAIGSWGPSMSLHQWVNEALMMAFFLIVGLEVKEQILVGELSSVRRAMLPMVAALGGMIVPALIYTAFNLGGDGRTGWGVPTPTDIAFALGVLSLLGKRVPLSMKVFLATLAIADDIGGIAIITVFYSGNIAINGLLIAFAFWLMIFLLGRIGVYNGLVYFALMCGVWLGFSISGIHATIAGVLIAIAIPAHSLIDPQSRLNRLIQQIDPNRMEGRKLLHDKEQQAIVHDLNEAVRDIEPPLTQLVHNLQPWVMFVVMPLFALSNAGVVIRGDILETVTSPVSLGVIFGFVLGKPIGITLFTWLAVRLGICELPRGLTLLHIQAVSMVAGIGFTVALFITELAFVGNQHLIDSAKLGILTASFIASTLGLIYLRFVLPDTSKIEETSMSPVPVKAHGLGD